MPKGQYPARCAPPEERFWGYVRRGEPNECWPWLRSLTGDGYGCGIPRRAGALQMHAHRMAWELSNSAEIPAGMVVMHSCDNPPCCNPSHLSLGTPQDNHADRHAKGRDPHIEIRYGEDHPQHVLTANAVREIRVAAQSGETQRSLGLRFGVSQPVINRIIHRKIWVNVA